MNPPPDVILPSSHFDWQHPPFAGGRNGAQVGLRPIAITNWLTPLPSAALIASKRATLASYPELAAAVWPAEGSEAALRRGEGLLAILLERAALPGALLTDTDAAVPLSAVALRVHEDLCLMWDVDGAYRLLAANLCMPSYWSLADKLGQSLATIHEPVSDLSQAQHVRMQQVFRTLPLERIFERRNWFIHGSAEGFEPRPDAVNYLGYRGPWYLRSERQTLRRLDTDLVLFAIRVDIEPLHNVAAFPAAHRDLVLALEGLGGTALADFGGADKQAAALAALASFG